MDDIAKPSSVLQSALRRQLRPLVQFLLASGITYPQLSEMLKSIYVEVAENEFKLSNKEQTDSRINYLTGIHRKDVKRLRNTEISENHITESVSLGALLVSRWLGNTDYLDQDGNPLPLPRQKKQGGELSFEALVASVNKDIRSRAILDEWLNLGIVQLDEQNNVCLNTDAFIPEKGYSEKAHFFAENVHDHLSAATHNMLNKQPPFMERAVFYDQLSTESIKKIEQLAEQNSMQLLKTINKQALDLQTEDKHNKKNKQRFRLGYYFFSDNDT